MPLVSVVLPFMNEEQFLEETIKSVLEQDYSHWELLLVDDGSTNASTEIAKRFAAAYPDKIFYHEHEGHANRGATVSRNVGVLKSKGALIALLDADDVWLPQKLSSQVAIFRDHPVVEMVAEASLHWYSWCNPDKKNVVIRIGAEARKVYAPGQLMLQLYPLCQGNTPGPSALMLKKSAVVKVGGFEESFVKQYQLYEDQAFLSKIYLNCHVYISFSCHNLYRQRPDSTMYQVKQKGQYHVVRHYFLEWLSVYIEEKGFREKALDELLQKALFPYHHPKLFFFTHTLPHQVVQLTKKAVPVFAKQFIKKRLHQIK